MSVQAFAPRGNVRLFTNVRRQLPALVWVALGVIVCVVLAALFSEQFAPMSPTAQDLILRSKPPSGEHLLGTDQLGRDILARLIFGARTALIGPLLVAMGGFTIGTILGLTAGYVGGAADSLIMRWVDLMFALPGLLVTLVIVGIVGGGYPLAVALLIIYFSPADTRIVRAEALRQRVLPYVEALRTLGISRRQIIFRHIIVNVMPIVVSYIFLDFAFALVTLSGLAYLGVGVPPGVADWGRMLFENRVLIFSNPAAAVAPGLAIVITAASMNLIGDWLFEVFAHRTAVRM